MFCWPPRRPSRAMAQYRRPLVAEMQISRSLKPQEASLWVGSISRFKMSINVTPIGFAAIEFALAGGTLIGLAAGTLYLSTGRIAGISGVFTDAFLRAPTLWRWLFVGGLVLAGFSAHWLGFRVPNSLGSSPILLGVAGLLVGFGTRLGNGCTSGHGVCGLGRFSLRSLVAVIVFITAAMITLTVSRPVLGVG